MSDPLSHNLYEKRDSAEWPRTRDVQPWIDRGSRHPLPQIYFRQNIRKP